MAVANDVIKRALRLLNVKEFGETLTADESADGLVILNNLLESLSNKEGLMYGRTQITHTLVASTGSYTIGSAGTITTTWPMRIESAFIRDSSSNDYPMEVINSEQYSRISSKTTETAYPQYLYYNRQWPSGTIYLYPEPSSAYTLVMNVWPQIATLAAGTTTVDWPPGYERFIEYALAVELGPEFKAENIGFLQQQMNSAMMDLHIVNGTETPILRSDAVPLLGRGSWNIRSGDYI